MWYASIRTFLGDVLGLSLSTGQIAKIVQEASDALGRGHAELEAVLPGQAAMNIDETGYPENGKRLWTWGFHVPGPQGFTWFHIDPSRSTEVLYEFLGEAFSGVIGCDYYSVYRKFLAETDAVMQFRRASHSRREVPRHARRRRDGSLRPEVVEQDQVVVPPLAPPTGFSNPPGRHLCSSPEQTLGRREALAISSRVASSRGMDGLAFGEDHLSGTEDLVAAQPVGTPLGGRVYEASIQRAILRSSRCS